MKFKEIMNVWLDLHSKKVTLDTYKYSAHLLNKHCTVFYNDDAESIKPKTILDIALDIKSKKEAKKILQILTNIYDYANVLGFTDVNPAARLSKYIEPHKEINHPHLDSTEELGELIRLVKNVSDEYLSAKNALLCLIFTAQRRSEITQAKWEEIDFKNKVWCIPPGRMKQKVAQTIPLTEQLIKILKEQEKIKVNDFIFPSRQRVKHPIYSGAPLALLHSLGYLNKQTLHGFRIIFSTIANSSGLFTADAIEAQLAHQIRGVRGVYNKSGYIDERRKLMKWYNDYLEDLSERQK